MKNKEEIKGEEISKENLRGSALFTKDIKSKQKKKISKFPKNLILKIKSLELFQWLVE